VHSLFQHQKQRIDSSYPKLAEGLLSNLSEDPLSVIYDVVYKQKSEEPVKEKLKAAALKLNRDSLSKAFWYKIHEGFTDGRGELFLSKLKEYGIYSRLFPPITDRSLVQQQNNEGWLEARLKLVDTGYQEGERFVNNIKLSVALLVVGELPDKWTIEDLHKVHANYHVPFECDASFENLVHYVNGRKQKYFTNLNKIMAVMENNKMEPEKIKINMLR